ncbi:major facilitator superfamily protein [Pandoraea eparura]|jgi:predicted MFS family arabinose efflux permease|uniref:Major facilitator superfamily protein n=1 Tax=Pandoraea eparura TaxID=2508291 RepID=A0A5E4TUF0_9BURK|nr:YbfB/YjiJ family MFS transporter [Pandoraea eparura]VVD91417.1 major facilitator superfamily protein [Pandoraea eparura]
MSQFVLGSPTTAAFNTWRATLSAACASLIGIGFARFAYTALLPAIIGAHWFSPATAAYLGAANLGGYLAGALGARVLARHAANVTILRTMMLVAVVAFFACAWPLSFVWFFAWRFASGFAGGVLMVTAAPSVLAHVPPSRRGIVSGAIFAGLGLGIAASGTLVPLLLRVGLGETWRGLGMLSLVLTAVAWRGWPDGSPVPTAASTTAHTRLAPVSPLALRSLYVEYALNAVALVPHMIFLVDYVARGLGKGLDAGANYWVLYGLGAIVGPLFVGHLADRIGFARALRVAYVAQLCAVLLPVLGLGMPALMVSSVVMGAFTPGIVPLVLGRVNELLAHHPARQKPAWSTATTSFATLQAGAAYGLSFLFAATSGNYSLLFIVGGTAMATGLLVNVTSARLALHFPGDTPNARRK